MKTYSLSIKKRSQNPPKNAFLLLVEILKCLGKLFDYRNNVKLFDEDASKINASLGEKTDLKRVGLDFRVIARDFDMKIKITKQKLSDK